ncbi:MAG: MotA/TolQ/ExbB proton channel family protein [Desulforegulaceae bacterium]|nr:MotA/TolQ/ExbB proton channel family protein [Desulforegulaceae bacterium]
MDFGSFIGIISGLSLIFSAIFLRGDFLSFVNLPGFMIVIGGTVASTLLTFEFRHVVTAFKSAVLVFSSKRDDPNDAVETMIRLCRISRKQGIIALSEVKTQSGFLKKACGLIADGSEEATVRAALETEINYLKLRHFNIQDVFKKMGTYAPAFGMLGTLIGLIQMLSQLANPETIGPAMAVALLTTFYGSLISTLLCLPIAGKLKSRTINEVMNMEIMLEGAVSILKNDNPLIIYEKLSSFIPVNSRVPMEKMDLRSSKGINNEI